MLWLLLGCFLTKTPPVDFELDSSPGDSVEEVIIEDCRNEVGHPACDFSGINSLGEIESLYDFYGQPIVLDLSAMWCGPCNLAGSEAQEIMDIYSADDLVYITVLIENRNRLPPTADDIQWWLEEWGITTAPVIGSSRDLLNNADLTAGWYLEGWPTFYLIDEKMNIKSSFRGYSRATLETYIQDLLRE